MAGLVAPLAFVLSVCVPAMAQEGVGSGQFTAPAYNPTQRPTQSPPPTAGPTLTPGAPASLGAAPMQPGTQATQPGALPPQPGVQSTLLERALRPEPPPTEFQRFVETATGRLLPIFGRSFFAEQDLRPSADNVPVAADYVVGPGDELFVRIWGAVDGDLRAVVDRNGQVSLPRVGTFGVAGVRAADLESHLRAQVGRLYTNFNLNVSLGQLRGVRVFVVGQATRPGVYQLSSPATALSALGAAGGPAPSGSMRKVTVRRGATTVAELDLYDLLVTGDRSKDVQLNAGDVVAVNPAGPRVAVTGSTDGAAIYELRPTGDSVGDVLRYSGGAPVLVNPQRVQLERVDPSNARAPRRVEEFRLDADGLATPMRDGDVLTLLALPPRFANAVTLRGPVAQPLRYPYTPGMRIRDLLPDRDALISPDFFRRKNQLVQVQPREPATTAAERAAGVAGAFERRDAAAATAVREAAALQGQATSSRLPAPADTAAAAGRTAAGAAALQGDSGALGARRAEPREELDPDDPDAAPVRRRPPTPLFTNLNWDYALIERLNEKDLTTQVIPFNLGRAVLQGDPAHDLELMPGDVVTIFSERELKAPTARQTRLVTLDGEVQAPGVYQLQAGETLRALLVRAGGLTPQAYVYGLVFTREETRRRQQQNLASAIGRLEALSATQAARDIANRTDSQATTMSSNAATQAQLARLRQVQPDGRIALELAPDATLDSLPEVPLEHGDRISVPPRPGFVTVAGAVVNSNAFLWRPDRTVGDYMRQAGVDEAADPANTFILRADGTVTSAADRRGWFGSNGIESERLEPGDAVIVPNQLDFETFGRAMVRNLKDWTQILANFGIAAAAIVTLRQ